MRRCEKRAARKHSRPHKNAPEFRAWKTLRWRLALFFFFVIMIAGFLTVLTHMLLRVLLGRSPLIIALTANPYFFILVILCVCMVIGTILAGAFGIYYIRPLKSLIRATKEVKKGNFKVQVSEEADDESEMGALVQSFNEMVHELDGIELFRNDFINNFSHEFKTPIVSIRGFAMELQREDLTPEERLEYAKIIAEESDRLAKLSTGILELSKLENQQFAGGRSEFYLDEQLRQIILLLEPSWTQKKLEMIPELEEVKVYSSEEILAHVWKNLISNAIKFTPEGGTVHVLLHADAEAVTVEVTDTGVGMSEEVRSHIFEKFYQGDPSHHHKGYGIGLTMVDRAVKLMGGTIQVTSREGEGSTFTVRLPRKTLVEAEVVEA